jgi:uncharacterized membrane protein required for colicin V production
MNSTIAADIPTWVPACAGLWLLLSTWLGWRRGIVRQIASLLGLVLAVVIGFWLGPLISQIVPAFGLPAFLKPLLGGILVGLAICASMAIFSQIIFRKTEDQGFGLIRLFYGLAGAFLGLLYGVAVLGLACWGIRFFGNFADGLNKGNVAANSKTKPQAPSSPPPLVSMKKILEESPAGGILGWLDPLPPKLYQRVHKIGQVFANPSAKDRLLADPSMEVLAKNTKILSLKSDPELQEALKSGDVWAILRNPKIQLAAADAQLLTALRTVDLDKILDHALTVQGPNPTAAAVSPDKSPAPRTNPAHAKP